MEKDLKTGLEPDSEEQSEPLELETGSFSEEDLFNFDEIIPTDNVMNFISWNFFYVEQNGIKVVVNKKIERKFAYRWVEFL